MFFQNLKLWKREETIVFRPWGDVDCGLWILTQFIIIIYMSWMHESCCIKCVCLDSYGLSDLSSSIWPPSGSSLSMQSLSDDTLWNYLLSKWLTWCYPKLIHNNSCHLYWESQNMKVQLHHYYKCTSNSIILQKLNSCIALFIPWEEPERCLLAKLPDQNEVVSKGKGIRATG